MQHIASISYGKDSIAMLEAIKLLGWPLDRIITVDVWATPTIPADLPPMVEFKDKADRIIKERYGIEVEHFKSEKSYEEYFYTKWARGKRKGQIYGFPYIKGPWCNGHLKVNVIKKAVPKDAIQYVGIAIDEPERIKTSNIKRYPLVEIGWTEADCRKWCEENNLLNPIYENASRGGCWFCHNMQYGELRRLRREYPEYWKLLLKWDADSWDSFKINKTVAEIDRRFQLEDEGYIDPNKPFRWSMLNEPYVQLEFKE